MAKQHAPHRELRVSGNQREPLEADLLAQVVVMLGRQLSQETDAITGDGGAGTASSDGEAVS